MRRIGIIRGFGEGCEATACVIKLIKALNRRFRSKLSIVEIPLGSYMEYGSQLSFEAVDLMRDFTKTAYGLAETRMCSYFAIKSIVKNVSRRCEKSAVGLHLLRTAITSTVQIHSLKCFLRLFFRSLTFT